MPRRCLQERRRSSGTAASMIETELGALREQSLTHVKERVALKAILDDKVRALIGDIGQSVAELPIEVRLLYSPSLQTYSPAAQSSW